mmetsp:Transcript_83644/g.194470  ORF Transcript_83644/g.194470 Transcript_83644/m.194470 type:complete len:294 (+) Transcript_83644:55-936(+)
MELRVETSSHPPARTAVELRAEAPAFVPTVLTPTLPPPESSAAPAEMPGDRLIRQLAAALVPPPTPSVVRSFTIPAAGLFCPYCAAGNPCSFHQPSSAGWETLKLSAAGFACMQAGHFRDRKKDEPEDSRRSLPPAPAGPPPAPPPVPCADVARDFFCSDCGTHGGSCLCHALGCMGGLSTVAHLLGEGRREGQGKGTSELEDVSTDAGGSEPTCAESDVSDAPLAGGGTSTNGRRGRGGPQLPGVQHSALPYMSTVWMPNVRAPAGAEGTGRGAAVWYPARPVTCSWGTGAR